MVDVGATQAFDEAARELFRPGDRWGATQIGADVVVEALMPPVTLGLLLVAGLLTAWSRRSRALAAATVSLVVVSTVLTQLLQAAVGRPDTHDEVSRLGGSYPSGHTVSITVCAGGLLLLRRHRPSPRTWAWVAVASTAMGVALLLESAHWSADVLGGALLGCLVLALAVAFDERRRPGTQLWWPLSAPGEPGTSGPAECRQKSGSAPPVRGARRMPRRGRR